MFFRLLALLALSASPRTLFNAGSRMEMSSGAWAADMDVGSVHSRSAPGNGVTARTCTPVASVQLISPDAESADIRYGNGGRICTGAGTPNRSPTPVAWEITSQLE